MTPVNALLLSIYVAMFVLMTMLYVCYVVKKEWGWATLNMLGAATAAAQVVYQVAINGT